MLITKITYQRLMSEPGMHHRRFGAEAKLDETDDYHVAKSALIAMVDCEVASAFGEQEEADGLALSIRNELLAIARSLVPGCPPRERIGALVGRLNDAMADNDIPF